MSTPCWQHCTRPRATATTSCSCPTVASMARRGDSWRNCAKPEAASDASGSTRACHPGRSEDSAAGRESLAADYADGADRDPLNKSSLSFRAQREISGNQKHRFLAALEMTFVQRFHRADPYQSVQAGIPSSFTLFI